MSKYYKVNTVKGAIQRAEGRDDELARLLFEQKIRELRGGCFIGSSDSYADIDNYITEDECPAIEAKRKQSDIECNERFAAIKKHSDVDASQHINYNE